MSTHASGQSTTTTHTRTSAHSTGTVRQAREFAFSHKSENSCCDFIDICAIRLSTSLGRGCGIKVFSPISSVRHSKPFWEQEHKNTHKTAYHAWPRSCQHFPIRTSRQAFRGSPTSPAHMFSSMHEPHFAQRFQVHTTRTLRHAFTVGASKMGGQQSLDSQFLVLGYISKPAMRSHFTRVT